MESRDTSENKPKQITEPKPKQTSEQCTQTNFRNSRSAKLSKERKQAGKSAKPDHWLLLESLQLPWWEHGTTYEAQSSHPAANWATTR